EMLKPLLQCWRRHDIAHPIGSAEAAVVLLHRYGTSGGCRRIAWSRSVNLRYTWRWGVGGPGCCTSRGQRELRPAEKPDDPVILPKYPTSPIDVIDDLPVKLRIGVELEDVVEHPL